MKEKWCSTPLSYRVVILFHAALMLLFILLYSTLGRQQVVRYQEELFRQRQEGGALTYTGELNGKEAVFTLLPDGRLEVLLDGTAYGPYTVTEDPSALPEDSDDPNIPSRVLTGVEIREGDEVLFRGGFYGTGYTSFFYGSDGKKYELPTQKTVSSTGYGTVYSIKPVEPSLKTILHFTLLRETVPRGSGLFLFAGLFAGAVCMASAFYADELFRRNLKFSIKNAENAEPSEWELMSRWISWLVLTVTALVFYIAGLSAPIP